MSETSAAGPPAWVCQPDGRLEPFDADRISQSLFAASEALGRPDAFLARELTDAILHFLPDGDPIPTTAQLAEQIGKFVRELGQPVLAQAYRERAEQRHGPSAPDRVARDRVAFQFSTRESPDEIARRCLAEFTTQAVFTRDLAAAHRDDLISLGGLDAPAQLDSTTLALSPTSGDGPDFWSPLPDACACARTALVLDSPDWFMQTLPEPQRPLFARWLTDLPRLSGRRVICNMNCAEPPAPARQQSLGPLFAATPESSGPAAQDAAGHLAEMIATEAGILHWHLRLDDFASASRGQQLRRLLRQALDGAPVAFVFDRPRRPVALADGIDRACPAVLLEVGLNLERFLRLPAVSGNIDAFFDKLPSLARMAVSAGAQKRKYLRGCAEGTPLARGFLLDRARLVVRPHGLESVVQSLTGQEPAASPLSLDLAERIARALVDHVRAAGRTAHLDVGVSLHCEAQAGSIREQITVAGKLHAVTGMGTAEIVVPRDGASSLDSLVDLLRFACKRTEVVRVQFRRAADAVAQLEFPDVQEPPP